MGRNEVERFWAKVNKTESCWLWQGSTNSDGYGRFNPAGRLVGAHRWSWSQINGPIPDGMCILHSCDTPACVNPSHLRLGTQADNIIDMYSRPTRRKRQGQCANHPDVKARCKGLCQPCYLRQWHQINPSKSKEYSARHYAQHK